MPSAPNAGSVTKEPRIKILLPNGKSIYMTQSRYLKELAETETLKLKIKEFEGAVKKSADSIKRRDTEISNLEVKNAEAIKSLATREDEVEALKAESIELKEEIATLNSSVSNITKSKESVEATLSNLRVSHSILKDALRKSFWGKVFIKYNPTTID